MRSGPCSRSQLLQCFAGCFILGSRTSSTTIKQHIDQHKLGDLYKVICQSYSVSERGQHLVTTEYGLDSDGQSRERLSSWSSGTSWCWVTASCRSTIRIARGTEAKDECVSRTLLMNQCTQAFVEHHPCPCSLWQRLRWRRSSSGCHKLLHR